MYTAEGTRASMQANRSRDTKAELRVRRLVHALGLRYRVAARPLPEVRATADLVFSRARIAVFIDGCFWHGCPQHHTLPERNRGYWTGKLEGNRARDQRVDAILAERGWLTLRFWEHQPPDEVAAQIRDAVLARAPRVRPDESGPPPAA